MTYPVRRVLGTLANSVERLLPRRYRLPYEVARERLANRLEPELLLLDSFVEGRDVALDIGANRGYYAYHLARLFRKVEVFEPNPSVLSSLEAWGAPNVQVHTVALSSSSGAMDLFVPVVNGVRQTGWASFDRDNLPDAPDFEVIRVPVLPLDTYDLRPVSFIKMDVEGHEPEVLAGAARTIEENRPVVLIEVKGKNRVRVFEFFAARGYAAYRASGGRLVPLPEPSAPGQEAGENCVFKPLDR